MPLYFRVFAVFVVFAVHALAFYWTTVALVGEKMRWRWYFVFYAGDCVVEWAAIILIVLIDMEEPVWYEPLSLLVVALVLSTILRLVYHVSLANALGASLLGHFLIYTIFDFLMAAATTYSPVFDGKYLYVATSLLLPYVLTLVFAGVIVFVLNKTEFSRYFSHLFQGHVRTAVTLVIFFLLTNLKILLDSFFLYRKLRFLRRYKNKHSKRKYLHDGVKRQHDKTIRHSLEDIKSFFTEIVIKFIFVEKIIHIQQGFTAHGADVL